jgi:hypothetical protein
LIFQPLVSWLVWSFENAAARGPENKYKVFGCNVFNRPDNEG